MANQHRLRCRPCLPATRARAGPQKKEDECIPDKLVMFVCLSLCINTLGTRQGRAAACCVGCITRHEGRALINLQGPANCSSTAPRAADRTPSVSVLALRQVFVTKVLTAWIALPA